MSRISSGLARAKAGLPAAVAVEERSREGNRICLVGRALGLSANATITIENTLVIFESELPFVLAPFAKLAETAVQKWAAQILAARTG
jgi:hypothetical protein